MDRRRDARREIALRGDRLSAHRAKLRLQFESAEQAERLRASLAPDDDGFLALRVDGAALVVEAQGDAPLGLLRTLDEAVAQLAAALATCVLLVIASRR